MCMCVCTMNEEVQAEWENLEREEGVARSEWESIWKCRDKVDSEIWNIVWRKNVVIFWNGCKCDSSYFCENQDSPIIEFWNGVKYFETWSHTNITDIQGWASDNTWN